ncbi:MAG: hypothetical protein AVO35_07330 [Candidatus Aegiribacteria sp. MLS_C]|nr:MAG: hypothetical protein AVO35_07330 [Candidatus Aegiribacteria sp. MLS_C]
MLMTAPRDYSDRRRITPVAELVPGTDATVAGRIVSSGLIGSGGRGRTRFQAILRDGTGELRLTFFNYRFIRNRLKPGAEVTASGGVDRFGGLGMVHPEILFEGEGSPEYGSVLPIYPLTRGLTQAVMRRIAMTALEECSDELRDILPRETMVSMGFQDRTEAVRAMHFPSSPEEGERARRLLALEEFFVHQSALRSVRDRAASRPGIPMSGGSSAAADLAASLPYRLTAAQGRVLEEIVSDLAGRRPMRRLLQGDVGSGKTVVAAAACAVCCRSGHLAAVVAPTEVLASQHHRNLESLLSPLGISCGLLTGGTGRSARRELRAMLEDGSIGVLVGTHAVLEDSVTLPRLGLCIIDEQHKFGVEQRDRLISGRDPSPHFMLLSATPIPRTLAMSLYGDLDLSVIDEMPPGRGVTVTRIVDRSDRSEVYRFLRERLAEGERAYVVYPLREASEELDLRDASSAFRILRRGPLGKYGVGLLTGAMRSEEKLEASGRFVSGDVALLVSTTVVEVGLDVPEATVLVVAHADRFGLSQLHQLRGRIGRGGRDSWCFLMRDDNTGEEGRRRLDILASTNDGFRIAEEDLRLRGPGEVAGTRQHGIPAFRTACLAADADLLPRAAALAASGLASGGLEEEFRRRFGEASVPEIR